MAVYRTCPHCGHCNEIDIEDEEPTCEVCDEFINDPTGNGYYEEEDGEDD